MTIEKLADLTWDKLKAISDNELFEICKQYFPETRPEMVEQRKKTTVAVTPAVQLDAKKLAALQMLSEEGIDIQFRNRKKK